MKKKKKHEKIQEIFVNFKYFLIKTNVLLKVIRQKK